MSSEGIGALVERAEAKFKLWFFRDIVGKQRLALFSIFGMPVDEISNQNIEALALRYVLDSVKATALVAQEVEIAALRAKVERYEARLEIDHCYVMVDGNPELERRDVPPEERETWPDGITCRDETIRLLEEQIAALTP